MSAADTKTTRNEEQHEVTLDEALKLAQGHHQSGNFILAERTYRDILRAVPDHFPTTQFLGILLFQSGNYQDALHYMGVAVKTEPDNPMCLNNYGGVLAQVRDYNQAIEYYDRALTLKPDYVDAMNNKAFALWSLGKYKEAEKLSRQVLEFKPDHYTALNGLGMALAKQVKFEEAIDVWEKASLINPYDPMVWINWGNALREMGRLQLSEEKCRKALELAPNHPEALNNLANVLRDTGKVDEAIELYQKATNERPDYYEGHVNKAIALNDNLMYEEAVIAARYAVAFNKESALGYSALSKALCEMGEFAQAHMAAQRTIHLEPEKAYPYMDLANVLAEMDQNDDAEAALQEALKREPDNARAYLQLAEVRELMNEYRKADEAIEQALEISPYMPMLWVRKGMISVFENNAEKGLEYINKAISISPEWYVPLQYKAEILISLNRNEEAEKVIREVLKKKKDIPSPYATLGSLKKFESESDPDFVQMKKQEKKIHSYGRNASVTFYYAMAGAYEDMKKYDKSFEYLKKANDLKRKNIHYVKKNEQNFAAGLKRKYTPEFIEALKGMGYDSDVPVFIVGMPRSGTTLTEQIISSHPDVYGAGELTILSKVLKNSKNTLQPEDLKDLGKAYVDQIKALDRSGKALKITDKMPANYIHIGLISLILPNAKIIHCRRNPIDTCLSCYQQNFARGQYWSYDLEDMADEYLNYLEIMEHWRQVLPGRFLEIDYEDTVGNFEEQARKLIDYVGLPWDDACLAPHEQKRAVLTASKAQVTKPIYKTSVEKWRRYEKQLQPLVRKLMPDQALPE